VRALLALALLTAGAAGAEPVTLRLAAVAPDGTSWARELRAFARDVENTSHGELRVKWYLGGIAGDELTALERVRHGQLDGEAGAIFCQRLAPSLSVVRLVALFQTRDEAIYVLGRLRPVLDEEFRKAGFANLGLGVFGIDALFSRQPVRTLADLRAGHYWVWSLDPVWQATLPELGVKMVATPLDELGSAYARHELDGFFAVPSAALAYQWSTQASYVAELDAAVLPACVVIANAAMDPLSIELQQVLRNSAAKFMLRFNQVSQELEAELMNGLFEKQGLIKVPVSRELRAELAAAAHAARVRLGDRLAPPALVDSVEKLLVEYRAAQKREVPPR
jgi:TRAP-type C4-dicarboxylate transport system substrate-binding protein